MGKEGEFCAEKMELTEGDKVRWDNGYSRWELDVDWEASHRNLRRAWKYLFLVRGWLYWYLLMSKIIRLHTWDLCHLCALLLYLDKRKEKFTTKVKS